MSYTESIILPPVISGQTTRTDSVIFTDTGSPTSFEVYIWLKCVSQTLIKSMSLCAVTWKNWGLSGTVASEQFDRPPSGVRYTSVRGTVADISHP